MDPRFVIDYDRGLRAHAGAPLERMIEIMRADLPEAWLLRYRRMCDGPTNVHAITAGALEYLFDYCTELAVEREDRVVVAFGSSVASSGPRNASRIRGWPGSDDRGDRGHFIAHAAGGALDINLFHQDAALNRGWSPQGKRYREMEQYCAEHPGVFCFSRPIYTDTTARPVEIEFGVLKEDGTLWVEVFANACETPTPTPTSPPPQSPPRPRRR